MQKKTLQELTIKNNFMFSAVMCDEDNCKGLLEMVLGFPIERVEVTKEKTLIYHPEYKGVRLDVYAKDEHSTHYNVEMQALQAESLERRSRYYHSQIDMELLRSGADYSELPDSYVIFVCDFDPFGLRKYCYTFKNRCCESTDLTLTDGNTTFFLSSHGKNDDEVPEEMVKFLQFVKADLQDSEEEFHDNYVRKLQNSVSRIKHSHEMEERYMLTELLMRDERRAGKAEGQAEFVLELLENLGTISDELRTRITTEKNLALLSRWHKLAAKAESLEQFIQEM